MGVFFAVTSTNPYNRNSHDGAFVHRHRHGCFFPPRDTGPEVYFCRLRPGTGHGVLAPASQGYASPDDIPDLLKLCRELLLCKNHHARLHTVTRLSGIEKDARYEHRQLLVVSDLYRRIVEYFTAVDRIATAGPDGHS